LTVGDRAAKTAAEVAAWLDDPRADNLVVDVFDADGCVAALSDYDLMLDGISNPLNGRTSALIACVGCHGMNLKGLGE